MTAASRSKRALPGDFTLRTPSASALRVNHAGEYGAQRIYAGQLAVLKNDPCATEIKHMAAQEDVHLAEFNRLLPQHGVRPTALLPLWHVGGWLMGAVTAAMGPRAAMACTVAVETVITEHYNDQLKGNVLDHSIRPTVEKFRNEEMEHHDIGLAHEAEQAPLYGPLTATIRGICRAAIWLSARV
jgi:ubiquinone biosynthesis monooxygenase Coq7